MKRNNAQSGQTLLIVVLVMIVALTVGLAIVSRSVTNLKISKQSEESQRAFQAAEAGIEEALKKGSGTAAPGVDIKNNANYSSSYAKQSGREILVNGGEDVDQDKGSDVWLSNYSSEISGMFDNPLFSPSLTFHWGTDNQNTSDCTNTGDRVPPALEVVTLYGDKNSPTLDKHIFDPCTGRTPGAENPSLDPVVVTDPNVGKQVALQYTADISLPGPSLIMKVIPVYNSTKIGIESNPALPPQGVIVTSTGKSGNSQRKLVYFESFPQIPTELFPYAILSQ